MLYGDENSGIYIIVIFIFWVLYCIKETYYIN